MLFRFLSFPSLSLEFVLVSKDLALIEAKGFTQPAPGFAAAIVC